MLLALNVATSTDGRVLEVSARPIIFLSQNIHFLWADPDDNSQLLFDALSFALKPAPVIRQDLRLLQDLWRKSDCAPELLLALFRASNPAGAPHRRGRRSGWASRRFFALPKAARSTTLCLSRRSARRPHASLSRS